MMDVAQQAVQIATQALARVDLHIEQCVEMNSAARQAAAETRDALRRVHERLDDNHIQRVQQFERAAVDSRRLLVGIGFAALSGLGSMFVLIVQHFWK